VKTKIVLKGLKAETLHVEEFEINVEYSVDEITALCNLYRDLAPFVTEALRAMFSERSAESEV